MITIIRRSFKTRAYKIVLWITFLAVAGVFSVLEMARSFFFGSSAEKGWVLQVNNKSFYAPEFMRAVADQEERMRMLRAQYGQYADLYLQMMGMSTDPKSLALNSLTRKALLNEVAQQLPLTVSDEKAQAHLKDPMFIYQELSDYAPLFTWDQSIGGINPLILAEYQRKVGISQTDFAQEIINATKRDDLKKLVEHSVYVPESELKEQFAQTFLGRKFSIATISQEQILNRVKKEAVNDEALQAYFNLTNAQERKYYVPEKRFVKIYSFTPSGYGIAISDEEVDRYYQNNKAQYIDKPAQVQVRRILLAIPDASKEAQVLQKADTLRAELAANPEKFVAYAKEHSADSKTASTGGLMPYFSKGTHERSFEKAAFTLPKENEVSAVIKTNEGYEILQLVGKKAQTYKPVAQVAADIKEILKAKKFNDEFSSDMRSVAAQADSKAALARLVKEKHGSDDAFKDVVAADNTQLSKTAFRLKKDETSYYQEPSKGVAVTLVNIKESFLPALAAIKPQVTQDYYTYKANQELNQTIAQIAKKGLSSAQKNEFKFEKTGLIRHSADYKGDEQEKQALSKKGFDLGRMFQLENIGGVAAYERNGIGYIIRLDDVAPFDQVLYDQKKAELRNSLLQQKKSLTMAGFVASLYRNAKINTNKQFRTEQ